MTHEKWLKVLSGSYSLIVVGIIYFAVSNATPKYSTFYNDPANLPLGLFTSIFLYDGWTNILFFVLCLSLFLISSYRIPKESIKRRAIFLVTTMFVIGVISNIYWVYRNPLLESYGQSGVIFGLYGEVFLFSAMSISPILHQINKGLGKMNKSDFADFGTSFVSLFVSFYILYNIVFQKSLFLNELPGVAYQIHALSFFLGVVAAVLYLTFSEKNAY